jgi:hypothetical protein
MNYSQRSRRVRVAKSSKRRKAVFEQHKVMSKCVATLPKSQTQLLLYQAHQPYEIATYRGVPDTTSGEVLVQVLAVGLNPIDWKSA